MIPADAGTLALVNAAHPFAGPETPDLAAADPHFPEILLERRAARMLQACIRSVGGEGLIVPVSGWRSQAEQQAIWDDTMAREGSAFTRRYVAQPGCSEHQTGLAIDLALAAEEIDFIRPRFPQSGVCGRFRAAAARYGFILRYPAGKDAITGIDHEPWHFRFVGVPHAGQMAARGLTLEEYLTLLRRHPAGCPLCCRSAGRTFRIFYQSPGQPEPAPPQAGQQRLISGDNCGGRIITTWTGGDGTWDCAAS